ncbi:MAG: c-type cytochrome [Myxococcales bacterium]|nr:c-type cytochrome [Polyangiaceae bacterium]MDW8251687.1 c-type cytochrome [Myxococcales bacterium]
MMRWAWLLSCGLLACSPPPEATSSASQEGAALYQRYCALCHGADGQGYAADNANALAHPQFLSTATDELLRRAIVRGRPGTPMSAWGREAGGPLDNEQVETLMRYLRGWQTVPSVDLSSIQVNGVAMRAQVFYEAKCQGCHGAKGQGGEFLSIANPEFLASVSDGYLLRVIQEGRQGTPMPAFADQLTPQTLEDLVVLIRSWQQPPGQLVGEQPVWTADQLLQNPQGADPPFDDTDRFVGVDRVWEALSVQKYRLALLDARAPSDYLQEHIAGAVSIPFYETEKHLEKLPRDVWLITYCGCPHAASGTVADALKAQGFTRVRVLDEGFYVWRERGYPTRGGPSP